MGDHRATIKIEFEIHGKKYGPTDWWINYSPDSSSIYGVDSRITEWFAECWEDAKARYDEQVRKYFKEQHAAEIEAEERAQLKRLQDKYTTTRQDHDLASSVGDP